MIKPLAFLLLCSMSVNAAEPKYPASAIPAALQKNAHAVQRAEEVTMKMYGLKDVRVIQKVAITVLNENGDRYAAFGEFYDKDKEIRDISGALYDAAGNLVRRLKKSEVMDVSAVGDNNLMDDSRMKLHSFHHKVYPYTVEYEVETRESFTATLQPWAPQPALNFAVESSRMTVTVPENYQLRYRQFNYKGEPAQQTVKGEKTFTWEARSMPALQDEWLDGPFQYRTTLVYLAPSDFSFGAYTGNMTSWNDFGKFFLTLNAGRDQLPDKVKADVHALTDNIQDPMEKVRKLYTYLQKNTRYISIQLGVGGWQTFDAAYVAGKGYGDCKALVNYMFSLLKEAGIRSHYTIVRAGDDATHVIEDFAMNQFNHIILCVPMGKDTTWLECTSQTNPFGYLSSFTSNRAVLLIDENGGKLVRTPRYTIDQNIQQRAVRAEINDNGDLKGAVRSRYTGLQQDWCHDLIHGQKPEKQLEMLKNSLNLPSYDIKQFHFTELPVSGTIPAMEETLEVTVNNYASVSGKRIFITPNLLNRSTVKVSEDSARRSDIFMEYPYRDLDTVEITIPQGYRPESIFAEIKLESKFGKYRAKAEVNGNKLTYTRFREKYDGVFPAADFGKLAEYYNAIYKADRSRIVFVKNE
ncbi:DUF3857 domain-containing protein [Chitinophaga lutea]